MQDVWSTAGKARWQGLHWGFLLAVSPERTGQSVSVFLLLLESMLKFGFAGKCDFIWVALGKAAFASLLISKVPLSENQSLEVSWKAVCKYYSEQWVPREKRRGKEPRGGHLCSHPMSPLLGRPLHPSGPQFPSLSEEEPRLDDSLALYKFRNLPMLCAM